MVGSARAPRYRETVKVYLLPTLIVDDEPTARRLLKEELGEIGGVEIVGEAGDGRTAVQKMRELRPELVLLDIQMPGMNGFDVLRSLDAALPKAVIFVTAYDHYAIRAFEAGAVDYLLKPFRQERLRAALDRARSRVNMPGVSAAELARLADATDLAAQGRPRRVVGRKGDEYFLLDLDDVLAFRAEGEIVWILTSNGRYYCGRTLRQIEQQLAGSQFRRIHRNALVNVDHVRKMSTLSSQRWLLTLTNEQELIVSKRQAHSIRGVLDWGSDPAASQARSQS